VSSNGEKKSLLVNSRSDLHAPFELIKIITLQWP